MCKKRKILVLVLTVMLIMGMGHSLYSQELLTASRYLDSVSERYTRVEDYEARLRIRHNDVVMEGTIFYKKPNLLRINFDRPEEQVLAVDGERLTLFLPQHNVVMRQRLQRSEQATMVSFASSDGLALLRRGYSVAFLEGPDFMPLEEGSDEMVRKLKLGWRSIDEGFREIILFIDQDMLIRRIRATTAEYETFQMDFLNIRTNRNIPASRFRFDGSPTAHNLDNFLFDPED